MIIVIKGIYLLVLILFKIFNVFHNNYFIANNNTNKQNYCICITLLYTLN